MAAFVPGVDEPVDGGDEVRVDEGEGLRPYPYDPADVLSGLRAVLGASLVEEEWFHDDPPPRCRVSRRVEPYRPPPAGTPVLLLTDLGVGGGVARRRWPRRASLSALARRLCAQDSPVSALVPYPPACWPAGLDRRIALVFWDRRSPVIDVRRAAGGSDAR